MSKGVLIFALDGNFKYTSLAEIAAKRVKEFLNLPITLVVNTDYVDSGLIFDKIIKIESDIGQNRVLHDGLNSFTNIQWLNFTRCQAYDLSPYNQTLVIDADYLISSNHLSLCFDMNKDFLVFNSSFDLSENRRLNEFVDINPFSIQFYWATVFYFKKTPLNRVFFSFVEYIKNNWSYFCSLYQIKDPKFRNDFAFSIAIHVIFNHKVSKLFGFIPGKICYSIDKDTLIKVSGSKLSFLLTNTVDNKLQPVSVNNLDVHVMNKNSILRVINE